MSWFKVDDQLAFNAKIVAAGNEAMGLWVRAGSWSAAQLTDGFIPEHMANAMANGMAKECGAISLVNVGLWDEADGGYQFHDWLDFQPSAEDEKERKRELTEKRKAAGKKGAEARWGQNSDSKPDGNRNGKTMANAFSPDGKTMAPTRPDPSSTSKDVESMRKPAQQAYPDEFLFFWDQYPLKRDKGKALRAWRNATRRADNESIIAGAIRYRDDPNRDDQYTKYAEGWLNGDGWEDEPLPDRARPSERDKPRTFGQMKHDNNMALWAQVQAEEEGNEEWPRQLGA